MSNIAASNITTTVLNRRRNNGRSYFNMQLAFGNGTLTYPANGILITPQTVGLTSAIQSLNVYDNGGSGFKWEYDQTNLKLRCFESRNVDWAAFTPTGSWVANSTYTGLVRVLGDTAEFAVKIALAGAPTSAALTVTIPAAYTFDTAKISSATVDGVPFGQGQGVHSGAFSKYFCSLSTTANSVDVHYVSSVSTAAQTAVDATHPFTWANTDELNLLFQVPVTGFGGNQLNGLREPATVAIAAQTLKCEVIGW